MDFVTSADGTRIAYERSGNGPAIIFVTGAFNDRTTCAPLARHLENDYTVVTYDRRGRGDSGDTAPYAVDREIDDIDALIAECGGSAYLFGYSSGAILSCLAVAQGSAVTRLALYEPPYPPKADQRGTDLPDRLAALVAQGRRGDAVALFQTDGIGLPPEMVAQIRQSPYWPALEAIAQTTVYDATITAPGVLDPEKLAAVRVPTVVLYGADTWPVLRASAHTLAGALPDAYHRSLPGGADHGIDPAVTAPAVADFLHGR
ncbi:MAG: alpha/beta fold hydrolase [Micromonosporaceae bacterium]